jgi:hypothetical protein
MGTHIEAIITAGQHSASVRPIEVRATSIKWHPAALDEENHEPRGRSVKVKGLRIRYQRLPRNAFMGLAQPGWLDDK